MKKLILVISTLCLLIAALTGCGGSGASTVIPPRDETYRSLGILVSSSHNSSTGQITSYNLVLTQPGFYRVTYTDLNDGETTSLISFLDEGQVSREENWNPDKPIFFEQATVRIEKWDLNSPPAPNARENYLNEGRFWRSAEEEDQAPKADRNLERILQPSMP